MNFELLETLIKELTTKAIIVIPLRYFIDNNNENDDNINELTLLYSIINNIKRQIELLYPQHDTLIILCDKILFSHIQDSLSLAMTLSMHRHVIDIQHEYMTPISGDIDSFFNKSQTISSIQFDNCDESSHDYIDRFFNEDGYISPIENDNDDELLNIRNTHLMNRNDIMFKQLLYSDDEGSFHSYEQSSRHII